jgi:thioredoxin-like negative regulator of GroEL
MRLHLIHLAKRRDAESLEDQIRGSSLPVLVEFVERHSAPCRMESRVLEQLGRDYADRLIVIETDVEHAPDDVERYSIVALPTLVLFNEAREIARLTGFKPLVEVRAALDTALATLDSTQ